VKQGCNRKTQRYLTSLRTLDMVDNHKPRSGPLFENMKESKKEFNIHVENLSRKFKGTQDKT